MENRRQAGKISARRSLPEISSTTIYLREGQRTHGNQPPQYPRKCGIERQISILSLDGKHPANNLAATHAWVKVRDVISFCNKYRSDITFEYTQHPVSNECASSPKDYHITTTHTSASMRHQHLVTFPDKGKHASTGNGYQVLPSGLTPYAKHGFQNSVLQGRLLVCIRRVYRFSHRISGSVPGCSDYGLFFSMVNVESDLSLPLFLPDPSNPITVMRHFFFVLLRSGTSQS